MTINKVKKSALVLMSLSVIFFNVSAFAVGYPAICLNNKDKTNPVTIKVYACCSNIYWKSSLWVDEASVPFSCWSIGAVPADNCVENIGGVYKSLYTIQQDCTNAGGNYIQYPNTSAAVFKIK